MLWLLWLPDRESAPDERIGWGSSSGALWDVAVMHVHTYELTIRSVVSTGTVTVNKINGFVVACPTIQAAGAAGCCKKVVNAMWYFISCMDQLLINACIVSWLYIPPLWQWGPVYPLGQTQWAEEEEMWHVPPFWQPGLQVTVRYIMKQTWCVHEVHV